MKPLRNISPILLMALLISITAFAYVMAKKHVQRVVLVVENQSASTNTPALIFTVYQDGGADLTYIDGSSPTRNTYSAHTAPPGTLPLGKIKDDLQKIGNVSLLPTVHCPKPASFGTDTTVTYNGFTSPDISCADVAGSLASDLYTLQTIVETGKTPEQNEEARFLPPQNPTIEFNPQTPLASIVSTLSAHHIQLKNPCLEHAHLYAVYYNLPAVDYGRLAAQDKLDDAPLLNSPLFCLVQKTSALHADIGGQIAYDAYALPATTDADVAAFMRSNPTFAVAHAEDILISIPVVDTTYAEDRNIKDSLASKDYIYSFGGN